MSESTDDIRVPKLKREPQLGNEIMSQEPGGGSTARVTAMTPLPLNSEKVKNHE